MTEIKRIKSLKISTTDEKRKNDWNEVKSIRNRMLSNSDWIFVKDVELEPSIMELWKQWRIKVRSVDDFHDIGKAMEFLADLQKHIPPVKYKSTDYKSIEHYKEELRRMVREIIRNVVSSIQDDFDSRDLMLERFEEAVRFFDGKTEHNILIELESKHSGRSHESVAHIFVKARKNYLLRLISVEQIKNQYKKRIDEIETLEECDILKRDLLVLGSKKWI